MSNPEDQVEFKGITYINHDLLDREVFDELPPEMKSFYKEVNGVVAYNGGIQFRGCGTGPSWNSLDDAWKGPDAFHKTYDRLNESDIPFAQDCLGDQFIYRAGSIWHLLTETGELDDLELDFDEFVDEIIEDPIEFLALFPLLGFMDEGNELKVGNLLEPSIPFSIETEKDIKIKAVPVMERLSNLKKYYLENR